VQSESAQKRRRLDTTLDNLEAQSTSNLGKTNASDTMAMALMHEVRNWEPDREEHRLKKESQQLCLEAEKEEQHYEKEREEQRREEEREERHREWEERHCEHQENMQTIMLMVAAFASAFNANGNVGKNKE
jgi:hypothetical protein